MCLLPCGGISVSFKKWMHVVVIFCKQMQASLLLCAATARARGVWSWLLDAAVRCVLSKYHLGKLLSCCCCALYQEQNISPHMPRFFYGKDKCCFLFHTDSLKRALELSAVEQLVETPEIPHVSMSTLQWWVGVRVFEGVKWNSYGRKPSFAPALLCSFWHLAERS